MCTPLDRKIRVGEMQTLNLDTNCICLQLCKTHLQSAGSTSWSWWIDADKLECHWCPWRKISKQREPSSKGLYQPRDIAPGYHQSLFCLCARVFDTPQDRLATIAQCNIQYTTQ